MKTLNTNIFSIGLQNPETEDFILAIFDSNDRSVFAGKATDQTSLFSTLGENRRVASTLANTIFEEMEDFVSSTICDVSTNESVFDHLVQITSEGYKYIFHAFHDFSEKTENGETSWENQQELHISAAGTFGMFFIYDTAPVRYVTTLEDAILYYTSEAWLLGEEFVHTDENDVMDTMDFIQRELTDSNNRKYFTREVKYGKKSIEDVTLIQTLRKHKRFLMMESQPGTGKSSLFDVAFPDDHYLIVGQAETSANELYGGWVPDVDGDNEYKWVDGKVTKAALEGKACFIDEVAAIAPTLLTALYPTMDGRDVLVVDDRPEELGGSVVPCAEGFWLGFAYNANVPGAVVSEALISRCLQLEFSSDYKVAEKAFNLEKSLVAISAIMAENAKNPSSSVNWAPQMRELIAFKHDEEMLGTEFAYSAMLADAKAHGDTNYQFLKETILAKTNLHLESISL